ncbi:hypothetical protein [Psychrobacter alimentarius]|uniref:hypothetical protein n=1 Tax=Psychrobacter alimentarius TaxID=261164 RepID=UPI0019192572|nr:hypothetical protein [Psychrobacter alimentarius]
MQRKYLFSIAVSTALLSACTTMNSTATSNSAAPSTKLDVSGLSDAQKINAYSNQLIKDQNTKYATFTNLQVVRDYRMASAQAPNPYGIYAVDGVPVKKFSNSFFGNSGWYLHAAKMATAAVKIPAGEHVIELGQINIWNDSSITLPKINYQADTNYIAVFEGSKGNRSIAIYTYDQDDRFSRMDRDSIILKDKIISQKID